MTDYSKNLLSSDKDCEPVTCVTDSRNCISDMSQVC